MTFRIVLGTALLGALIGGTALEAQERVRIERRGAPGEREMTRTRSMNVTMPRRSRLGITVDLTAQDEDKYGATIDAVTPGGPAAKAGLRAGDVITALDGKSLTSGEKPQDADDDSSVPGLRLIRIAARLGGGDTVDVAYRRGNEEKLAQLITSTDEEGNAFIVMRDGPNGGPGEVRNFTFRGPRAMPRMGAMPPELAGISPEMIETINIRGDEPFGDRVEVVLRGGLGDLELAPLNPDLGKYFGATDGVLVLNTPKETALGLKGGDVVSAVDGRKVTSPAQLQRILRTYEPGESLKLEIQRDRKRETITGKVPERKNVMWRHGPKANDDE